MVRIRTEGEGGAWCPKDQIRKGGNEFLQIDLGTLKVITLVETQGRFGNGQVNLARYYIYIYLKLCSLTHMTIAN